MVKKFLSVFICAAMMLTPTLTPCAQTQGELLWAEASEEVFYSQPFDDGYTDILGISQTDFERLEQRLFTGAENFDSQIDITDFAITYTGEKFSAIANFLYKAHGHPEAFQIEKVSCTYYPGGEIANVCLTYNRTPAQYAADLAICETEAEKIIFDLVESDFTDLEKALLVHDRIDKLVDYVNNGSDDDHNIVGVLINKKAVCEGYAQTYCYLLKKLGIESRMASSNELVHAWNIIILNGKKYHIDATWDDPLPDIDGRAKHTNFLCSTQKFKNSEGGAYHNASDYNTEPTDTTYDDYFWNDCDSGFEVCGGKIYYIDKKLSADSKGTAAVLCSWSEQDGPVELVNVGDRWTCSTAGAYYPGNYSRLATDGRYLYYNLSTKIMRYDPVTGESSVSYIPDLSGLQSGNDIAAIYGFKIVGNEFYLNPAVSPNFSTTTKAENLMTYNFGAEKTAYSMTVETLPQKTEYFIGDTLDPTGLTLSVRYTDGTTGRLSSGDYELSYDFSSEGEKQVSVEYRSLTKTFDVSVKCPSVKFTVPSVSVAVGKTVELSADTQPAGATVTFSCDSSEAAEISGNELTGKNGGDAVLYAKITVNGIEYFDSIPLSVLLLGDVNLDGEVDINDVLIIMQTSVKKIILTQQQETYADMNGDRKTNVVDALIVLKSVVGKI